MRYFLTLAYRGTRYAGWQRQPNAVTVQETLETALSTILRQPIEVTGCGRTDAGVHARYYVAHFDVPDDLPAKFLYSLNGILPHDIAVYAARPVHGDAHARYDAYERRYQYHIALRKDPFSVETAWLLPHQARHLDMAAVRAVATLLPQYEAFFPFCKTDSGADHYRCAIGEARWENLPDAGQLVFHISANRFLRGMVRLVVGACISAGQGLISVDDVRKALDEQRQLPKSLSVPPQGLALTAVQYPYL